MCGIWGLISEKNIDEIEKFKAFNEIARRGPDRSIFLNFNGAVNTSIGFHRLAIMENGQNGDQPFKINYDDYTCYITINGEIYNYKELIEKFELPQTQCDCEVVKFLYEKEGIKTVLKEIRGEFAIAIVKVYNESCKIEVTLARDHCGVRPLFYSVSDDKLCYSSELKGICSIVDPKTIKQFPTGCCHTYVITKNFDISKSFYNFCNIFEEKHENVDKEKIRQVFESSVISMLGTDRPLGALLSGGLDSSLVVSVASKHLQAQGKKLKTFSIGMPGSTDKDYAFIVADYCQTDHTHVEFTVDEFISAIDKVIYVTETFDITTIRASVGQYLISKWISENTDIKVLLIGDGSDELTGGYRYFLNSPNVDAYESEISKLLSEIHFFDALRADRSIAYNGLEARVPFLSYQFITHYLSIDPQLRMPQNGVEKYYLRSCFDNSYLPDSILWRKKEAFSDGVSSAKTLWSDLVHRLPNGYNSFTDEQIKMMCKNYNDVVPFNRESLFYRVRFHQYFGNCSQVIPHFWMPNWSDNITDPSARVLAIYN